MIEEERRIEESSSSKDEEVNFKTGKLDPVRKPTHVSLTDHLDVASAIPSVPAQGWSSPFPNLN